MARQSVAVIGGIDTHKDTHHAAAITVDGVLRATAQFATSSSGSGELLAWLRSQGDVVAVGVEGTGSYGASVTRHLIRAGVKVLEVNRPNRQARRSQGKSDPLDAEQAARAVLARTATVLPKTKDGPVEAIRTLRVVRSTAVKSRTQTMNALHAIIVTAPDALHDELVVQSGKTLIRRCARLRPSTCDLAASIEEPATLLLAATKTALRELATRWLLLDEQIKLMGQQLAALTRITAPNLVALPGVGPEIAGQLLVTAGDNPRRVRNEAAFARLCGVAPQPASSGRTTGRHRLSRGGDRAANTAIYMIAITRLRDHTPTMNYVARRQREGLTKREIIRCLKRYIAREIFHELPRSALDAT